MKMPKITFWRGVFIALMGAGLYATYVRFFHGLGASTNLSDATPWGLWIGFDVLCGVGLAAGGFTMAGMVYIFNIERFKPVIRPAILTAFLGYLLVCVALLFDLGQPQRIWHPLIMWNPHSVMFEVGWCVTLYTTVLALEFSPIVLEKFRMNKTLKIIKNITIPLVILGIILSTLHQSSLGSLFLIAPEKLYPLWYSSLLPVHFFITSVAVGFAMVIMESYLSSRAFNKKLEMPLLNELGRAAAFILGIALLVKLQDINRLDLWGTLFIDRMETWFWWAEMLTFFVVPIILLSRKSIRRSEQGLFVAVIFVVIGFVINRLNVSITAFEAYTADNYFPSWMEIVITMAIVAVGFAAFRYIAKNFPIFEHESHEEPAQQTPPKVRIARITGAKSL